MSPWSQMVQAARLAPKLLGDSTGLVWRFLHEQEAPGGGFKDRSGQPDLYYTPFGLSASIALGTSPLELLPLLERTARFLAGFDSGADLDFVHLCSLARCRATLGQAGLQSAVHQDRALLGRIEQYRSGDGGYHPRRGNPRGSAYGAFLACAAYHDFGSGAPTPEQIVGSIKTLEMPDGGWINESTISPGAPPAGATNATAAAVAVLKLLGAPVAPGTGAWLLARIHPLGGFTAGPAVHFPDLLSTATALHSLALLGIELGNHKGPCLDFIDSLWTNRGAFHGHWADNHLDCEYTFYGLVSLGYLT